MSDRLSQLHSWLRKTLGTEHYTFAPASSDASFRRYFRVGVGGASTKIVMDAPPERENCAPFIKIAKMFGDMGLHVPQMYAQDLAQGFLLLSDLGEGQYLRVLNQANVGRLYGDALSALMTLQAHGTAVDLPSYDRALLLRELEIFREWYLGKHVHYPLNDELNRKITECYEFLVAAALEQPRVIVHRDFHSRNLLLTPKHNPGILDFQDAVIGPITYDLVSLLRDCYITWPLHQIHDWVRGYQQLCLQSGVLRIDDEPQFLRWFDLMGVQRHLKAAGIFARLNHRDGKPDYLQDVPRTLSYVQSVAQHYPELNTIKTLLDSIPFVEQA